jgi:hypothetical protein
MTEREAYEQLLKKFEELKKQNDIVMEKKSKMED